MPIKGLTEILLILDRSTSMKRMRSEAIEGFNRFLEQQKAIPGQVLLTLVFFADDHEIVFDRMPIEQLAPLTQELYTHQRGTALFDTLGDCLERLDGRLKDMEEDESPEQVAIAVITDGQDFNSRRRTRTELAYMIKYFRENREWEFIFLAADEKAFLSAAELGIPGATSKRYAHSGMGISAAFDDMTDAVANYRTGSGMRVRQRERQQEDKKKNPGEDEDKDK